MLISRASELSLMLSWLRCAQVISRDYSQCSIPMCWCEWMPRLARLESFAGQQLGRAERRPHSRALRDLCIRRSSMEQRDWCSRPAVSFRGPSLSLSQTERLQRLRLLPTAIVSRSSTCRFLITETPTQEKEKTTRPKPRFVTREKRNENQTDQCLRG